MVSRLLAVPVARYIRTQRDRLRNIGTPLSDRSKFELSQYFSASDLDRVRVVEANPLPIPPPPFSRLIHRIGVEYPDLALAEAVTFDHVIAAREQMSAGLLFHEMIHVVQYRLLGVTGFARQYVHGLLDQRVYEKIPLEHCAFELEARFRRGSAPFDVEFEVAAWIDRGRL